MMFYRDDSKIEVDLVDVTDGSTPVLCEIKSGQTYRPSFVRNLMHVASTPGLEVAALNVIYGGTGAFADGGASIYGIREWFHCQSS